MIIRDQDDVTKAVLSEVERTPDPRTREILSSLVRHLHAFAREVRLTEEEFRKACVSIAELGQRTTETHNEVVRWLVRWASRCWFACSTMADNGQTGRTANLLGPFWRMDSPFNPNGGSIVRSPTPGDPLFVTAAVKDSEGKPVAGAEVDVWHSSTEGFYEHQDPGQADMNLRGKFITDEQGLIRFRSIKPAGYPIPVDGPVGDLLRAQGRHNMRPAHIHFLIYKPGFKTHISQVYVNDDKYIDSDVQFGVTKALVGNYIRHERDVPPAQDVPGPWYSLDHTLVIERGEATLPRPPISGKAEGEKPRLQVLERR